MQLLLIDGRIFADMAVEGCLPRLTLAPRYLQLVRPQLHRLLTVGRHIPTNCRLHRDWLLN